MVDIQSLRQIQQEIESIDLQICHQQQLLCQVHTFQKQLKYDQNCICNQIINQLNEAYSKVQQLDKTFNEQGIIIDRLKKERETQLILLDHQSLAKSQLVYENTKIEIKLLEFNKFFNQVHDQQNNASEQLKNLSNIHQFKFYNQDMIDQDILDIEKQSILLESEQQNDIDYQNSIVKQLEQRDDSFSNQFITQKFQSAQVSDQSVVQINNQQIKENQAILNKLQFLPQQNKEQIIQQSPLIRYQTILKFDQHIKEINKETLKQKSQIRFIKYVKLIDYDIKLTNSKLENKYQIFLNTLQAQLNSKIQQLEKHIYEQIILPETDLQFIERNCRNESQLERLEHIQNDIDNVKDRIKDLRESYRQTIKSNLNQQHRLLKEYQFISLVKLYQQIQYKDINQHQDDNINKLNNQIIYKKKPDLNKQIQDFANLQKSYSQFFIQEMNLLERKIIMLSQEQIGQINDLQIQRSKEMISNMLTQDMLLNNKEKKNYQIYLKQAEQFQKFKDKQIFKIAYLQYTQKKKELENEINLCERVKLLKKNQLNQCETSIKKTKSIMKRLLNLYKSKQEEQKQTIKQFNAYVNELEIKSQQFFDKKQEFLQENNYLEGNKTELQISIRNKLNQKELLELKLKAYKLNEKISEENNLFIINRSQQLIEYEALIKRESNSEQYERDLEQQALLVQSKSTFLIKRIEEKQTQKN